MVENGDFRGEETGAGDQHHENVHPEEPTDRRHEVDDVIPKITCRKCGKDKDIHILE